MEDLSPEAIRRQLAEPLRNLDIRICRQADSTMLQAQRQIRAGETGTRLLVAQSQTGGMGTRGRSFASPEGGAYFTLCLYPAPPAEKALLLTPAAAVAAARAARQVSGREPEIKWVNDLLLDEKKACGILCRLVQSPTNYGNSTALIGVGADVLPPEGGFPPELMGQVTAMCPRKEPGKRESFIAVFLNAFLPLADNPDGGAFFEEYRSRLGILGQAVRVHGGGGVRDATALDLEPDFRLKVRYEDGSQALLSCDEVSIRSNRQFNPTDASEAGIKKIIN